MSRIEYAAIIGLDRESLDYSIAVFSMDLPGKNLCSPIPMSGAKKAMTGVNNLTSAVLAMRKFMAMNGMTQNHVFLKKPQRFTSLRNSSGIEAKIIG